MRLIVLMSTYNGEKYIRQQLDSLLNQTVLPDKIIIRDDGSRDDTVNILEEYSSNNSIIDYYLGKNMGVAKSFWNLICNAPEADYYALCDQDDVWFEDKIECALKLLDEQDKSIPLLYCGSYILTDEELNPIKSDVSKLYGYTDFAHSLMYHTSPGCTFVFNNHLRQLLVKYDPEKEYMKIHDSMIHKICALFGIVVLDKTPHMYYRQHSHNQIGMSADKFKVFMGRIRNFLSGRIKNYRSLSAKSLLNVYGDICDKDKKKLLEMVANYEDDMDLKREMLKYEGFKSNSVNDVFLYFLILVNYIYKC